MDLQAIEARLAAATPGPWSRSGHLLNAVPDDSADDVREALGL